eukprot:scaffold24133_cov59-Phaeocystis_antarctica.AAC.3
MRRISLQHIPNVISISLYTQHTRSRSRSQMSERAASCSGVRARSRSPTLPPSLPSALFMPNTRLRKRSSALISTKPPMSSTNSSLDSAPVALRPPKMYRLASRRVAEWEQRGDGGMPLDASLAHCIPAVAYNG